MRMRKCAVQSCRTPFAPRNMMHKCCSPDCALAFSVAERERHLKSERRAGLIKLKRRADHLKDAERACNAYIRARDDGKPCISCGRMDVSAWHAGHYMSVGARPALRFDERNIHRQCKQCNVDLHGNAIPYRIGLINRIGEQAVAWLEGPHAPVKYQIEQAKAIKDHYRVKLAQLKKERT